MKEISLPVLECTRCGHVWVARKQSLPKVCPKCKNPNWNKSKGEKHDKANC